MDEKAPARKRGAAWWFALILFILLPVPFGHWLVALVALLVCGLLAWYLVDGDD